MTSSKPCQAALRSIDRKSCGLTLEKIVDQGDCAALKWENLSPDAHIDIVFFHCYQEKYPDPEKLNYYFYLLPEPESSVCCGSFFLDDDKLSFPPKKRKHPCYKNLLKEAAKLALDDLKEKPAGSLLSENAVKVCSHAPDLARTLSGLIMSSSDLTFQGECLSLLRLDSDGIASGAIEECIENKLSVMELNDRKPKGQREATPFLFKDNDDCHQILSLEEYTEGDDRTMNLTDL